MEISRTEPRSEEKLQGPAGPSMPRSPSWDDQLSLGPPAFMPQPPFPPPPILPQEDEGQRLLDTCPCPAWDVPFP